MDKGLHVHRATALLKKEKRNPSFPSGSGQKQDMMCPNMLRTQGSPKENSNRTVSHVHSRLYKAAQSPRPNTSKKK
jgi:hypothetical protein